jgi:hypothetical protein
MLVPAPIRYLVRSSASSLRYQPPTPIASAVVLCSSIQSEPPPAGFARISLMTTEPGSGTKPLSFEPGEPSA